jgi:hypothetical protein
MEAGEGAGKVSTRVARSKAPMCANHTLTCNVTKVAKYQIEFARASRPHAQRESTAQKNGARTAETTARQLHLVTV